MTEVGPRRQERGQEDSRGGQEERIGAKNTGDGPRRQKKCQERVQESEQRCQQWYKS